MMLEDRGVKVKLMIYGNPIPVAIHGTTRGAAEVISGDWVERGDEYYTLITDVEHDE